MSGFISQYLIRKKGRNEGMKEGRKEERKNLEVSV
jgi:hypothetical protein